LPISDDVGRRPAGAFRVLRALHRAGLVSESKMEEARQRHGSADYRNAQGVMRQVLVRVLAERYDVAIAHVQCPVSLVWSSDDTEAPLAQAERAVGRLANASLSVHQGAGHLTPLTIPDALRQAVLDRLA
jgi:pimeloyl-ACP methyl ester carboxylesterase